MNKINYQKQLDKVIEKLRRNQTNPITPQLLCAM